MDAGTITAGAIFFITLCVACGKICKHYFVRDEGLDEVYRCANCGAEKRERVR